MRLQRLLLIYPVIVNFHGMLLERLTRQMYQLAFSEHLLNRLPKMRENKRPEMLSKGFLNSIENKSIVFIFKAVPCVAAVFHRQLLLQTIPSSRTGYKITL